MAPLRLDVLAVPFGSPRDKDRDGEYFSSRTDLGLEAGWQRWPLYWHHTRDSSVGDRRIGWANGLTKKADGWWTSVEVDDPRLLARLEQMAGDGKLFASSGSVAHLVRRGPDGEIRTWPLAELSLTPSPTNGKAVARLAKPVDASLTATLDGMDERLFSMQREDRGRPSPALDRLQDAFALLRENLAA